MASGSQAGNETIKSTGLNSAPGCWMCPQLAALLNPVGRRAAAFSGPSL